MATEKCRYLQIAQKYANKHAKDEMKLGAVVVYDGEVIGKGANGSDYHKLHGCKRRLLGVPTGQDHHLCEGCRSENHAEYRAVEDALNNYDGDITGFDLYLYGHWHCCRSCWDKMLKHGVNQVFVDSTILRTEKNKVNQFFNNYNKQNDTNND